MIDIQELTQRRTNASYPNFLLPTLNASVPVVVRTLEKGDLQLVVQHEGKEKVVTTISPSAYNVDKLLRTTSQLIYRKSETEVIEVKSITDYLSNI